MRHTGKETDALLGITGKLIEQEAIISDSLVAHTVGGLVLCIYTYLYRIQVNEVFTNIIILFSGIKSAEWSEPIVSLD